MLSDYEFKSQSLLGRVLEFFMIVTFYSVVIVISIFIFIFVAIAMIILLVLLGAFIVS